MYPALAAAEAMGSEQADVSLSFVGSVGGMEKKMVHESGLTWAAYDEVQSGPVHGVGLVRAGMSAIRIVLGTLQALVLIARQRPRAVLTTGGWASMPVTIAAWLLHVPVMVYLPDIEPGLTIRALAPFARRVGVTTEESKAYFKPGQVVVTGYPLRAALKKATRAQAVDHFGLDSVRKTLLIFGGSRGARSINHAVWAILPDLLGDGVQVIHVTGELDWPDAQQRTDEMRTSGVALSQYHAYAYLHSDMALALAAADLAVSRSGASVLGEFPYFKLPAVLVPYPHAWRYQKVNADVLASRGAALRMDDDKMPVELLPTLRSLLADPARMNAMRAKLAELAQSDGARNIAREMITLAGGAV